MSAASTRDDEMMAIGARVERERCADIVRRRIADALGRVTGAESRRHSWARAKAKTLRRTLQEIEGTLA